jgi:hypothetical protein
LSSLGWRSSEKTVGGVRKADLVNLGVSKERVKHKLTPAGLSLLLEKGSTCGDGGSEAALARWDTRIQMTLLT